MWFSLPLWFALPALFSRSVVRFPILPAALIFVVPLMLFGHTIGWAAGQCWGIRYMTPSVVLLVAVGLAVRRPWRHHPWRFVAVCALGLLIAMGGVLAPYRGQQQLAFEAAAVEYPGAAQMDNHVNFDPRLSPLHTHWIYAALAATGRLERGGTDNTTLPMFGVRTAPGKIARLDQDVAFRHWWIVFGAHAFGWALWPWTFAWWLVTAILFALALRPSARD